MSGTPTVTVIPAIIDNTIGSSQTACPNIAPLRLDGSVPGGGIGNFLYKWQISTDNFSTYSDAPGVNDGQNYFPAAVTGTTYYRRVVTSGICSALSNPVTITLGALPAVVSVDGPVGGGFCSSVTLTASLVAGTGTNGTIYYQNTISNGYRYQVSAVIGCCKCFRNILFQGIQCGNRMLGTTGIIHSETWIFLQPLLAQKFVRMRQAS